MPNRSTLLAVDGAINVVLGVPAASPAFYPSVLGGVLLGIGIALLIERARLPLEGVGLGLAGAVAINLCAGLVLAGWLVVGDLRLPARGLVFLWSLVLVLVGLSGAEVLNQLRQRRSGD